MALTFEEYWAGDGTRFYASSHEERARHAWRAAYDDASLHILSLSGRIVDLEAARTWDELCYMGGGLGA